MPGSVIDWSELEPGLGPHDLAYCLLSAPHDDRAARDLALLRRYWDGLQAAGVSGYSWALCRWDYRCSLRRTAAVIDAHGARGILHAPPR